MSRISSSILCAALLIPSVSSAPPSFTASAKPFVTEFHILAKSSTIWPFTSVPSSSVVLESSLLFWLGSIALTRLPVLLCPLSNTPVGV